MFSLALAGALRFATGLHSRLTERNEMPIDFPPLKNDLLIRAARGTFSSVFCILAPKPPILVLLQARRPNAHQYG